VEGHVRVLWRCALAHKAPRWRSIPVRTATPARSILGPSTPAPRLPPLDSRPSTRSGASGILPPDSRPSTPAPRLPPLDSRPSTRSGASGILPPMMRAVP
jgi:hypothetical protein